MKPKITAIEITAFGLGVFPENDRRFWFVTVSRGSNQDKNHQHYTRFVTESSLRRLYRAQMALVESGAR